MQQNSIDLEDITPDDDDQESTETAAELEARPLGWRPKEEWSGPDDQWRTAEEFMAVANRIDLRKQNRVLKEDVERLKGTIGQFTPYMEKVIAKAQAERDDALERLREQQEAAINIGDGKEFRRAQQEIDKLTSEPEPSQPQAEYTPEQQVFLQRNPWFGVDKDLTNYANEVSNSIKASNPYMTPGQYFQALEQSVKENHPDKFDTEAEPSKKRAPKMEGGNPTSARTQKSSRKTYDNLPPDAKANCDRFVKEIPNFTVEKYLAQYEWD